MTPEEMEAKIKTLEAERNHQRKSHEEYVNWSQQHDKQMRHIIRMTRSASAHMAKALSLHISCFEDHDLMSPEQATCKGCNTRD